MKHGLEGINLYNPVEGKLDKIIDYFVDFYGEKYRDRIEDRLKNSIYIFTDRYNKTTPIKQYFAYVNRIMMDAFEKEMLEAFGLVFKFKYSDIAKQMKVMAGIKDKNFANLKEKEIKFLQQFEILSSQNNLNNYFENDDVRNYFSDIFDKVEEIYDTTFRDFDELLKEDGVKLDHVDENVVKQIELKYLKSCFKLFGEMIAKNLKIKFDDDKKLILKNSMKSMIDYMSGKKVDENVFREILSLSDRYKNISIDNFLEILDIYKPKWQSLVDERDSQLYILRGNLAEKIAEIENEIVFGEDTVKSIKDYILMSNPSEKGFAVAGVRKTEPDKPVSVIVASSYLFLSDDVIVHEMNHSVFVNSKLENGVYTQKIGLKKTETDLETDSILYSNREYTGLNEVINEYLAQKIVGKIHKDNFRIGYKRDDDILYRIAFPILGEFIEENMDNLIEICMSEDVNMIYKYFNKKDIDTLAKIIDDLFNMFGNKRKEKVDILQNEIEAFANKPDYDIFEVASNNDVKWSYVTQCYLDIVTRFKKIIDKIKNGKIEIDAEIDL